MHQRKSDSQCRTVVGREDAGCRRDGRGASTTGAVGAIHRAAGNQAVQSAATNDETRPSPTAAERPSGQASTPGTTRSDASVRRSVASDEAVRRSSDGADQPSTDMCPRCTRRYRAGKPLNCEACESALQRSTADDAGLGTVDGDPIQPKLTVSDPADASEREAEHVAAAVLQQDDPPTVDADGTLVERRANGTDGAAVDQETTSQIQAATSGGIPLPRSMRSDFESRFGRDFSDVRVHTGGEADRVARSIDAEAFTLGSDIVFARGNYRPESDSGRALLAHELTHVVQQNEGGGTDPTDVQRVPSETPHGEPYVKGVKHDHQPSGEWDTIQERSECNVVGDEHSVQSVLGGGGVGPVGCVCRYQPPGAVLWWAMQAKMGDKPLARSHVYHYRNAGGADYQEDVRSLVLDDDGVRYQLVRRLQGSSDGHFKLEQHHYHNQDFRFTFGAIDKLYYDVDSAAGLVHVWFADRYEWHPVYPDLYDKKPGDEARVTNCVHAAAVELKDLEGAADFWMYGHGVFREDELTGGSTGTGSGTSGADESGTW